MSNETEVDVIVEKEKWDCTCESCSDSDPEFAKIDHIITILNAVNDIKSMANFVSEQELIRDIIKAGLEKMKAYVTKKE